jgi:subtilisin family serine protease
MLFAFIFVFSLGNAQEKSIRLRQATIETPSIEQKKKSSALTPTSLVSETSGVFLIQFTQSPKPEWREQLTRMNVDLLNYVPDDAFVAKLDKARLDQIEALDFVRWLGEYRADYKIASELIAPKKTFTGDTVDIALLLSPNVNESEASEVRKSFTAVHTESSLRFGRIIRGRSSVSAINALAQLDSVLWIEPAPKMRLLDESSSKIVAGDGGPNTLLSQSLGYDGSGVKVSVVDTGFDTGNTNTLHMDLLGRVSGLVYGALSDWADGHGHGTHVAGIIAGNGATGEEDENGLRYGLGVAPGASILAQRTFDSEGRWIEPLPDFSSVVRDAITNGAIIGCNSWGNESEGAYDLSAAEFDAFVRDGNTLAAGDQPFVLVFAAGNVGSVQGIESPAVAKNLIAVGASQSNRTNTFDSVDGLDGIWHSSSRGPSEDGRIKPDLVAPGATIASLRSRSLLQPFGTAISSNYVFESGTSQSAPHVAGAAAVFVDYFRTTRTNVTPSPALVKAALINGAVDMPNSALTPPAPNHDEGWGRVWLPSLLASNRDFDYVDQSVRLTNGQTFERNILVVGSAEPLKVTLTYTDVPGFPGAIPALVNDVDLEIIAPDGKVYHGNQFSNGKSVAGAPARDNLNNVEGVLITSPQPGIYVVRVMARNIVEDACLQTGVVDQDFAMVTSGDLAQASQSIVLLDRPAYRAPGVIRVTVVDPDLAGNSSVTVFAKSSTETVEEAYVLTASGSNGTFTGAVSTVTFPAVGQLQIAHGDGIEVRYFDASAVTNRIANAMGDFAGPIVSGVGIATNQQGQLVVVWNTDEPANSRVDFGTNLSLTLIASNSTFATGHSVPLSGLINEGTYSFSVSSSDQAGNSTTNDNGGALFTFAASLPAVVLLVDDYHFDQIITPPPLAGYTEALDELGVRYEIWNTFGGNSPGLSDLLPFRVVVWRLPEFNGSDTWSPAEQNALAAYVASGGSLFVASMQVLTNLDAQGQGAFARNILKVQKYEPDATVPQIVGASNDSIGNGIATSMDYAVYTGLDKSDTITPRPDTSPVYFTDTGRICGLRYPRFGLDSAGRVVFLSFPLDAVPMNANGTNNRVQLLGNALRFLAPGYDDRATITLDSPAYTVPSLVTIEVDEHDLAGAGTLNIGITNIALGTGLVLPLTETTRAGTFRGYITLSPTNSPVSGTLVAQNGHVIRAQYFDTSIGQPVSVSSVVDTVLPNISNVAAQPAHVRATISWTTGEPCDALVQYGESPLSFRSVYDPALSLTHSLTLENLLPNTVYYFRLVSRDIAGNAVTEDNAGELHTFSTLQPLIPPWSDNFDGINNGWTVTNSLGSQSQWTRGVPENGAITNGNSPPNAWGSNLNGDTLDQADTYLVSPAIHLLGGNEVTLHFWHNYDFPAETEFGYVYILTNNTLTPIELQFFDDSSQGQWVEAQVNLSAFTNQVVNVMWRYRLSAAMGLPRTGWFIDDVSISVTNTTPGTIIVTNNLWQGRYSLSGPASANGQGKLSIFTNMPHGEYVIEFMDVPHYQTPPAQTNTMLPGQTILFEGGYLFSDINTNGISDAWETYYFGNTSLTRTMSSDTDGDDMTDLEEFLAGTDPNGPLPSFQVTARLLPDFMLELEWPTAPGHSYNVEQTIDFDGWQDVSGPLLATGTLTNFVILADGEARFYQVSGTPTAGETGPAATLIVTTNLLPDGSVEVNWPSTPDRGYRVECSSNAVLWIPCSPWLQAVSTTTSFVVPPVTNSLSLFRVEVDP